MSMNSPQISVHQALVVQQTQLKQWRILLKPWAYKALLKETLAKNKGSVATHHWDVWRGSQMEMFLAMLKQPEKKSNKPKEGLICKKKAKS